MFDDTGQRRDLDDIIQSNENTLHHLPDPDYSSSQPSARKDASPKQRNSTNKRK